MKTTKPILKIHKRMFGTYVAFALAFAAWLPRHAQAQVKGATLLMTHVKTPAQIENLKTGDAVAMVCEKCKSVMVHNVTAEKGHVQVMTVGAKHLCPGCNSTITTVGAGKSAKEEVKHVCEKCGSNSVFCCATKAGSGATEGMEKK
jgi:hypothetical protein